MKRLNVRVLCRFFMRERVGRMDEDFAICCDDGKSLKMARCIRKPGEKLKKGILTTKRNVLPIFLAFVLTIVMVPRGTVSSISVITQTSSRSTIYLDPPTIDGAVIGVDNTLTVNLSISDARNITGWQAGLLFNASVLECTAYSEGDFLQAVGDTLWLPGTIDNTLGVISIYACTFMGSYKVSGSGQLANLTFRVKAPGVSDLHLRNVDLTDVTLLPVTFNIIDAYTVIADTTHYTVGTVSDSTGKTGAYNSGFYNHAFSSSNKEISFNVTTPKTSSFSNVSVPKTLLSVDDLDDWTVIIDGAPLSTVQRIATYNGTHFSIYFTYGEGVHKIQIIGTYGFSRDLVVSLEAPAFLRIGSSLLLNATVHNLGENNETDVELQLFVNSTMVNSTVISSLEIGYNYTLSYFWVPPFVVTTYNITAYAPPKMGENFISNNVETKFVTVEEFYITTDPNSGPIGTKTTVNGAWFPSRIQVSVTFNDILMGYAVTDEDGDFTFVLNVPVSVAGVQTVRASFGEANSTSALFIVIEVTSLDIEIDVGAIHYRGESAEFHIQTSFKGTAVNATSIGALLYKPNGTRESLTVPSPIITGFYKITYPISEDAQNGTYALVIEADYTTGTIESHGTTFKTFLLSSTLAEEIALIEGLGDEIESLKAEIVRLNTTLNSLSETLTEELALTEEDIKTQIAALNATLNSLNEAIAQLETRISAIKSAQEAFTPPLYAAVVLALIAAVGAIITILLRRKPVP